EIKAMATIFKQHGDNIILITDECQKYKAQPLTSKILTPTGWTTMGEIKVGDAVVDPDGGVGYVEGVYPQTGKQFIYGITTKSGAYTEATGSHLWLVNSP